VIGVARVATSVDAPSVRAAGDAFVAASAGRNRAGSMPSGMTRARPAKPFASAMRAASMLHAEMPEAARSAHRSSHRNGTG
jgi:hypothetical protein